LTSRVYRNTRATLLRKKLALEQGLIFPRKISTRFGYPPSLWVTRHTWRMTELGSALRRWRERLAPTDVGLTVSSSRRARGLRREEVADMANISLDYIARLEQGRVAAPSVQVVESLATALRLSNEERDLLFELAGRAAHQSRMRTDLTPSVQRLLEQLQSPICVYDALWNQLAWNHSFANLLGDPSSWTGLDTNLVYRYLVGAPTRVQHDPGDRDYLGAYVADLRATQAKFPNDPEVKHIVESLRAASTRFVELWDSDAMAPLHATHKILIHPQVGQLALDCEVLRVEGTDLRVVLFTAAPGTTAASSLQLLASFDIEPAGTSSEIEHEGGFAKCD
jgi:transcriptional regulator with XRE-family HTH domain